MGERTIKKLRQKFILCSFLSFFVVMLFMGGMIYIANLRSTEAQIHATLDYIADNGGSITKRHIFPDENYDEQQQENDFNEWLTELFHSGVDSSPEFRYYFSVILTQDGEVSEIKTGSISSLNSEEAEEYARKAIEKNKTYGSFDNYYYKCSEYQDGKIAVFLDCSTNMANTRRLLNISLLLILFGAIVSFIIIRFVSSKMIMPEIKNAERQKQFITNAGHELKTPLAVIRANTELDMMINGENEWNQSTLKQVEHMTGLIQDLITIAKAEESEKEENLTQTDVSKTTEEVVSAFEAVAIKSGKTVEKYISEGISMQADESKIRQLVTLLTDNAIKYCDDNGKVTVNLTSKGKNIKLSVYNDYKDGAKLDCSKFFERFYRADTSHNIDKGGYGIGLSIAETIVKRYKGSIGAVWKDGIICFTCILKSG